MPLPYCEPTRIEHLDFNDALQDVSAMLVNLNDGDAGTIGFVYANRQTAPGLFEDGAYFRKYDHATQSMLTPYPILISGVGEHVSDINLKRLDNGRIVLTVIHHGAAHTLRYTYSDDYGVTWAPLSSIDTNIATLIGMGSDGVSIWVAGRNQSGAVTKSYRMFKYNGSSWSDLGIFFTGLVSSNELWCRDESGGSPRNNFIMFDATHGVMLVDHFHGVPNPYTVDAYYTTDGATWTNVVVATATTAGFVTMAWATLVGTRVVVAWIDHTPTNVIKMAYSDDQGATWTVIGEITSLTTLLSTYQFDNNDASWSIATYDETTIHFACTFRNPNNAVWAARGPVSATGWAKTHECDPSSTVPQRTITSASFSQCFAMGADAVIAFHMVWNDGGPSYFTYDFIIAEGEFPEEIPPPEEEPEGFRRMFRRGVIQAERGAEPHIPRAAGTIFSWRKPRWLEK